MSGVIRSFPAAPRARQISPEAAVRPPATPLVQLCQDRYRSAVMWRGQAASGPANVSADALMHEARRLYNGLLSPEQAKLCEDLAGVKVNLIAERAYVFEAWLRDTVLTNIDSLITLSPTPLPELSSSAMDDVARQVKDALMARLRAAGYPDPNDPGLSAMPLEVRQELALWLAETARSLKGAALAAQTAMADAGAKDMERLLHDQLIQADFRREFSAFVSDLSYMPFAVIRAPGLEAAMVPHWAGNKWTTKSTKRPTARRVSPWNFYWSPDSTTPHNGGFIAEVLPTRKDQLMAMATRLDGWRREAVIAALDEYSNRSPIDWLHRNPETSASAKLGWTADQSIDRLVVHGVFSGRELQEYGIGAGIDRNEFVEAAVTLVGDHVIQARLAEVPQGGLRPYHATSFRRSPDHFCGRGLANLGADLQVAAYSAFWSMMRNASYASGARGEVDITRIRAYIKQSATPESVLNQQFHFVDPDLSRTQGGAPAFRYHNVAIYVGEFQRLLEGLGQRMDRATGVPAIASGGLDYATAARSHAGLSQLLGSALKTLKRTLDDVDTDVLEGVGRAFYQYNMQAEPARFSMLDANVKARGTAGLLERELKKSAAIEALTAAPALVQLAQVGGQQVPPALVTDIVAAAAEGLGVDTSAYPELQRGGGMKGAVDRAVINRFGSTPPVPTPGGGLSPAT